MVDNNSIDLRRKNADLTDAIAENDRARQEQYAAAARATSAKRKARELEVENERLKAELKSKNEAIAERDFAISEWMLTNAAFKKIAKSYAFDLGISNEKHQNNFDLAIVNIAEESPEFAHTSVLRKVKAKLDGSSS